MEQLFFLKILVSILLLAVDKYKETNKETDNKQNKFIDSYFKFKIFLSKEFKQVNLLMYNLFARYVLYILMAMTFYVMN